MRPKFRLLMLVLGLLFGGLGLLLQVIMPRVPVWIAFLYPTLVMLSGALLPEVKDRGFFKQWMTYPLLAAMSTLVVHYAGGIAWGLSALISFVGWPLLGTLVTADDDLPGGWSNPDGTIPPPWRTKDWWGQVSVGISVSAFVAALDAGPLKTASVPFFLLGIAFGVSAAALLRHYSVPRS